MTQLVPAYRWTREEFLRAHEPGVFEHRVEFVNGEVWPVVIGDWHGATVRRLAVLLTNTGGRILMSTLPSGNSLPDPDCWVAKPDAVRAAKVTVRCRVGRRLTCCSSSKSPTRRSSPT